MTKEGKPRLFAGARRAGRINPFGPAGATRYDAEASQLPVRYKKAHAIQNELALRAICHSISEGRKVVVDLGAGTASDGCSILEKSANAFYIGIDYSDSMIAIAKRKMRRFGFNGRSRFLKRGFRVLGVRDIVGLLATAGLNSQVAVVISSLALHHYELAEKRRVYSLARALLGSHGLFLLTDLFANEISDCESHAFESEIDDISRAEARLANKIQVSASTSSLTVNHYQTANVPQKLASETALLKRCGFSKIDIVYRHAQLAVLAAQ
jgi:hypothetical protein